MQTFLPYPDFRKSAECLDHLRLGKQRVECKQIINALTGKSKGWRNHPATKMWENRVYALKSYANACIVEWKRRGYNNTMGIYHVPTLYVMPDWFGDPAFHCSHQSNLLRKKPEYYGKFGWQVPDDLPYIWPSNESSIHAIK